jgi:uncharacterized protein
MAAYLVPWRLTASFARSRPCPAIVSRVVPAVRFYSTPTTDAALPPLLQKLKGDLKTAMRAKDAARLAVLRSVLAAVTNASKTAKPVATDAQLVALLQKTARASEDATAEFRAAGRDDLVDKEQRQVDILREYVAGSGVAVVAEDDLRAAVAQVVGDLGGAEAKPKLGDVMKALFAAGGPLEGKSVEKADLARIVKEVVG